MKRTLAVALALASLTISLALVARSEQVAAQDESDEEEEGESATPAGPPTKSGRTEVSGAVGQAGMTFELQSKARLFVPPNLPIGSSRMMRFAESRGALNAAHIAEGFRRIGPILSFDGAINATSAPVVVSIRQPRDPGRPNLRLVLAMEQATICREGIDPLPGVANLCSGWELVDARHSGDRLSAEMRSPGGYRLVFGSVPVAPAELGR
jgi:hypothetical protein